MSNFEKLKTLDISNNPIGAIGLGAIAHSLPQLITLDVSNILYRRTAPLSSTNIKKYLRKLTSLTSLRIARNLIGDSGFATLSLMPLACQLTLLDVRDNEITNAGMRLCRNAFTNLKELFHY